MALKVVITGAANGIGRALAEKYLEQGALVWGIDRDQKQLAAVESKGKRFGKTFTPIICDLSDLSQLEVTAKELLKSAGGVDIWINNAGISGLGDFTKKSFAEFEIVMRINLHALVLATRIALDDMEARGCGTIVNVASVAGHLPCPYLTAYSASKFAVVGFSHSLREELKLRQVPVKIVVVSPGFVDTQMIGRGTELGFPEYLSFTLADTNSVAREIYLGVKRGREDIYPTLNGKVLASLGRYFPGMAIKGSRLLLSKSIKDLLLLRKQPPA